MGRGRPHRCPYCGSTSSHKKGTRQTRTLGLRKIRRCNECGRKFTPRHQKSASNTHEDTPCG